MQNALKSRSNAFFVLSGLESISFTVGAIGIFAWNGWAPPMPWPALLVLTPIIVGIAFLKPTLALLAAWSLAIFEIASYPYLYFFLLAVLFAVSLHVAIHLRSKAQCAEGEMLNAAE